MKWTGNEKEIESDQYELNKNHKLLLDQINWNNSSYIQKLSEENDIQKFFLQEPQESQNIRRTFAHQLVSSSVLFQANNNVLKMHYFRKSLNITPSSQKCNVCKRIVYESMMSVMCKQCKDAFHLECFEIYDFMDCGAFFHDINQNKLNESLRPFKPENEVIRLKKKNKEIMKRRKQNKKNESFKRMCQRDSSSDVYWICDNCINLIEKEERILFELVFPFEIQQIPNNPEIKIYTLTDKNVLKGDISTYKSPVNFYEALADRNFIFQDDCIYLAEAKQKNNTTFFTTEPIDVIYSYYFFIFNFRVWIQNL